jgi:hypothetical protein
MSGVVLVEFVCLIRLFVLVEWIVRDLMEEDKGKIMKKKVLEWKKLAEEATDPLGSSSINLNNFMSEVLLSKG